jgi:hypothetical protein
LVRFVAKCFEDLDLLAEQAFALVMLTEQAVDQRQVVKRDTALGVIGRSLGALPRTLERAARGCKFAPRLVDQAGITARFGGALVIATRIEEPGGALVKRERLRVLTHPLELARQRTGQHDAVPVLTICLG